MTDKISDQALVYVQGLLKHEREVEDNVKAWELERTKTQYAKSQFIEYLNLEHNLKANDIINSDTGIITRVAPVVDLPLDTASPPSLPDVAEENSNG